MLLHVFINIMLLGFSRRYREFYVLENKLSEFHGKSVSVISGFMKENLSVIDSSEVFHGL